VKEPREGTAGSTKKHQLAKSRVILSGNLFFDLRIESSLQRKRPREFDNRI